jgi:glycosyltransferase involved in cell wall biosynthesis
MSPASPTVSAVIPAFNGERYLGAAIESVLAQTHEVLECLVVDDGSTDTTADVARRFGPPVRVVAQENAGVAAARNRGASEASGEQLAFLDQDDAWLPERLERQLEAMRRDGRAAALCASRVIGEGAPMGKHVAMRPEHPTLESLLLWRGTAVAPGSNLLIARPTFDEIGGFDERLGPMSDWELLTRIVAQGGFAYVSEPMVEYRWHSANTTRDLDELEADVERAYEVIIAREGARLRVSPRKIRAGRHRMLAAANLRLGRRAHGWRHVARAALNDPLVVPDMVASRLRSVLERGD